MKVRIISFTKKWDKLNQDVFTTFRMPRKDALKGRDWREGEAVQVYYHNRCKDRQFLGVALIMFVKPTWVASIDDEQAVADGFSCRDEMVEWLRNAHTKTFRADTIINKLTLKWVSRPPNQQSF